MKKLLLALISVSMVASLASCGGKPAETSSNASKTTPPATTSSESSSSEADSPDSTEDSTEPAGDIIQVSATIVNGTEVDIQTFEMSASGKDEWGEDLLGGGSMPHGTYTELVLNVDSANLLWDIRVSDSDGNELEWYELDISEMPADGFGIELLWDGETGIANVVADPSQLAGDYSAAQ